MKRMDDNGWQLLPKPAKRLKKLTCFDKCIFCQTGNANLRVAKPSSLEKVVSAPKQRQDEVSYDSMCFVYCIILYISHSQQVP